MDEQRIEMALKLLGECVPRAPEKTVEKMVKTVNALEAERNQNNPQAEEAKPKREAHKVIENKNLGGPRL